MSAVAVDIMRLPHGADLPLPEYATPDSAGVDLLAAVSEDVSIVASIEDTTVAEEEEEDFRSLLSVSIFI